MRQTKMDGIEGKRRVGGKIKRGSIREGGDGGEGGGNKWRRGRKAGSGREGGGVEGEDQTSRKKGKGSGCPETL